MPSSAASAPVLLGAAALGVAGAYLAYRNRLGGSGAPGAGEKKADCSFDHVQPYPGDPLAVPAKIYTDHVKSSPYKASMGLSALDMHTLIELGSHYLDLINERRKAIEEHPEKTVFMLPVAKEACMEYLHYVADYCSQRYPTVFEKINGGKGLLNKATGRSWDDLDAVEEPMKVVGELIPDDVAIMTKDPTPAHPDDTKLYKYNASVNCYSFPGRMMQEKIGLVMEGVHAPVPEFNKRILKPVNSWMDILQSPSHRLNWFLQPDHRYFRPEWVSFSDAANDKPVSVHDIYYRVERQTFIRLPKTKAVVFGIRLYVNPLMDVIKHVEEAERLAGPVQGDYDDPDPTKRPLRPFIERLYSAVCVMTPDFKKYKGMVAVNPVVQKWLEENRGMGPENVRMKD